jgi:hypothetical protein
MRGQEMDGCVHGGTVGWEFRGGGQHVIRKERIGRQHNCFLYVS